MEQAVPRCRRRERQHSKAPVGAGVRGAATVLGVGGVQFDPWEEIYDQGYADLALAFARLFWPTFVERQGCVLIEHRADEAAIAEAFERSGGDPRAVEERLNRLGLWGGDADRGLRDRGRDVHRGDHVALLEGGAGRADQRA